MKKQARNERSPEEQQIALECLRLAHQTGHSAKLVAARAERYFDFVMNASPESDEVQP